MRNDITVKSVLNRQYVVVGSLPSIGESIFERRRSGAVFGDSPRVSFKPFERVYPIALESDSAEPALAASA